LSQKCEIIYENSGNPKIKESNTHVSISHSNDFVVILLSSKKGGIDAEDTQRNTEKLKTRFLSEEEINQTEISQNPNLARVLYWSAKEAIYKCALQPNADFQNQIAIMPFKIQNNGQFNGILKIKEKKLSFQLHYFFIENNVVVYTVE
jgi:4'-phosphopantetheinyl transferase EntD